MFFGTYGKPIQRLHNPAKDTKADLIYKLVFGDWLLENTCSLKINDIKAHMCIIC